MLSRVRWENVLDENNPVTALGPHTHLQHAAIVSKTFELIGYAHAELLGACLHGAADHEAVTRLEHMQRAGDGGEGHGAHKDGHFLVQATTDTIETLLRLFKGNEQIKLSGQDFLSN